jgi:hypothetical protein
MTDSDRGHDEDPDRRAWISSGLDATGLLVAAFFGIVVEGFFTGPGWPLALEISLGIAAGIIVILVLTREFWKSHRVNVSITVYQGASWVVGLLAGIGIRQEMSQVSFA